MYRGPVAGLQHSKYQTVVNELTPGTRLTLIGEPNNRFDRNKSAIRIELNGVKIGYIPAPGGINVVLWDLYRKGYELESSIVLYDPSAKVYEALTIVVNVVGQKPEPPEKIVNDFGIEQDPVIAGTKTTTTT